MAVGIVLASPFVLGTLVPIAALGAIFRVQPFDLTYNHRIRDVTGTRPLPNSGEPRRVACAIATVWVGATAVTFWAGVTLNGYIPAARYVP